MTSPIMYQNGRFLDVQSAGISPLDRSFLHGDGLFETIRVVNGQPGFWHRHMARLARGAGFLRITMPVPPEKLLADALELIRSNACPDGVLRLTLSRGTGPRGCSTKGAHAPLLVMLLFPMPDHDDSEAVHWRLINSRVRIAAGDPLTRFKTCNRLPYILARMEADDAGVDDALLLNTDGHVVESSCANLFWMEGEVLHTPPLESGALDGITRTLVLEQAARLGVDTVQKPLTPFDLRHAHGLFLTLATRGIVAVDSLDGRPVPIHPLVKRLHAAINEIRPGLSPGAGTE